MLRLGQYMRISIGVMMLFNAGYNTILAYAFDVLSLLIYLAINALIGAWGVWLIREGWRGLNKIEEMKKWNGEN